MACVSAASLYTVMYVHIQYIYMCECACVQYVQFVAKGPNCRLQTCGIVITPMLVIKLYFHFRAFEICKASEFAVG